MRKVFTAATPRYRIEGVKGEYFDVFSKRANAIKAAIKMAIEYPGTTFVVVKKVNLKDKVIFRFKLEVDVEFRDVQDMYQGAIEVYQKKYDTTRYWRKPDDS